MRADQWLDYLSDHTSYMFPDTPVWIAIGEGAT